MCVGVPMKVIGTEGIAATCTDGERIELIDLSLVGDVPAGTWLLTFLGAARDIISADEAEKITAALNGLRSIMQGGDLGEAFADLNAREPQLPLTLLPHSRMANRLHEAAMTHPLIDRLTSEFGYPVLHTTHDLTEYTRGEGVHCVFITGDPVRNLETTDVAVVLPELKMTFQGAFDCAVVATEFEDAAKEAAGVFKTPALVFYREGVVLGSIPKVRDWDDYMSRIPQILALHPEGA